MSSSQSRQQTDQLRVKDDHETRSPSVTNLGSDLSEASAPWTSDDEGESRDNSPVEDGQSQHKLLRLLQAPPSSSFNAAKTHFAATTNEAKVCNEDMPPDWVPRVPSQPKAHLRSSASLFVPKTDQLRSGASLFVPAAASAQRQESNRWSPVHACVQRAFANDGDVSIANMDNYSAINVNLRYPDDQSTRSQSMAILLQAIRTLGPNVTSMNQSPDASQLTIEYVDADQDGLCWEFLRHGHCPRGQSCRWQHAIAEVFLINVILQQVQQVDTTWYAPQQVVVAEGFQYMAAEAPVTGFAMVPVLAPTFPQLPPQQPVHQHVVHEEPPYNPEPRRNSVHSALAWADMED